jgi:sarcosine oxidase delta subunit
MMQFNCPHCGPRAQGEFVYERTVDSVVALDMPAEAAMQTLFTRNNPRGIDAKSGGTHLAVAHGW